MTPPELADADEAEPLEPLLGIDNDFFSTASKLLLNLSPAPSSLSSLIFALNCSAMLRFLPANRAGDSPPGSLPSLCEMLELDLEECKTGCLNVSV